MKNIRWLLSKIKNKSNIDYKYYHLFNNNLLDLNYQINNFTINYIVYIINSDFSIFYKKFQNLSDQYFTDIFLERLDLSKVDKSNLFSIKFRNLFWLKFNNITFIEDDYDSLLSFLQSNSLDINRLFLENTNLRNDFFIWFNNLKWFNNLSFLNFDNNILENSWLDSVLIFLNNNNIDLEYLSLINTYITDISNLILYLNKVEIRILDLSSNILINNLTIINFIKDNNSIKELYLRNITFSDEELELIINLFKNSKTRIYNLRLSINYNQEKYLKDFSFISLEKSINFDINFLWESDNIFSTIYFKQTDDTNLEKISNDYFYVINSKNIDNDFDKIIKRKDKYLKDGINLFLFDFNDYTKIDYLILNYNFNYIYVENYYITDNNFIKFLNSIKKQKYKKYKINFISIEISEFQLNYLIENFPKNIFYIEVNLNKIDKNRELYISRMLKNKAFIFENMELYQKLFK